MFFFSHMYLSYMLKHFQTWDYPQRKLNFGLDCFFFLHQSAWYVIFWNNGWKSFICWPHFEKYVKFLEKRFICFFQQNCPKYVKTYFLCKNIDFQALVISNFFVPQASFMVFHWVPFSHVRYTTTTSLQVDKKSLVEKFEKIVFKVLKTVQLQ